MAIDFRTLAENEVFEVEGVQMVWTGGTVYPYLGWNPLISAPVIRHVSKDEARTPIVLTEEQIADASEYVRWETARLVERGQKPPFHAVELTPGANYGQAKNFGSIEDARNWLNSKKSWRYNISIRTPWGLKTVKDKSLR